MESDKKVEMIQRAIRKLMEDEEINANISSSHESVVAVHEDEEENENSGGQRRRHNQRQLLSKLLSELEEDDNAADESKSKQEAKLENALPSEIDEKTNTSNEVGNSSNEEIIKELKSVKRQNSITHYLLTAMIVITLAWQISEVSLILKIKDGLNNPLKSVGGMIKGFFRSRPEVNVQDAMKQASEMPKQVIEPTYLPGLKIPELPHLDLPGFDASDDDDDDDDNDDD